MSKVIKQLAKDKIDIEIINAKFAGLVNFQFSHQFPGSFVVF